MKIKKSFILIIVLLVISVLTACQPSIGQPSIHQIENYTPLLYQNAVGGAGDTSTPKYTGRDFYAIEDRSKSNIPAKELYISGNKITMHYLDSQKTNLYKDELDFYTGDIGDDILIVVSNSNTGKIVRYIRQNPCTNRDFKSDVTPKSSEEDFTKYVKNILLEQCGVSVENRQVKIVTEIIKKDGTSEFERRFVNNSSNDPNFNATYTYTFYSEIGGVSRFDDVIIRVTNVGEVEKIEAMVNDEAYRPFEKVKIDREKLVASIDSAFSGVKSQYNIESYDMKIVTLPTETDLWVEATISYNYKNGDNTISSGVKYLIKVAELVETKN